MHKVTKLTASQKVATKRIVRTSPAWTTTNLPNENRIITHFPYAAREKHNKNAFTLLSSMHSSQKCSKLQTWQLLNRLQPNTWFELLRSGWRRSCSMKTAVLLISHRLQGTQQKMHLHCLFPCTIHRNAQSYKPGSFSIGCNQTPCSNFSGLDDDDPVQWKQHYYSFPICCERKNNQKCIYTA